jgi:hypothetical protein
MRVAAEQPGTKSPFIAKRPPTSTLGRLRLTACCIPCLAGDPTHRQETRCSPRRGTPYMEPAVLTEQKVRVAENYSSGVRRRSPRWP